MSNGFTSRRMTKLLLVTAFISTCIYANDQEEMLGKPIGRVLPNEYKLLLSPHFTEEEAWYRIDSNARKAAFEERFKQDPTIIPTSLEECSAIAGIMFSYWIADDHRMKEFERIALLKRQTAPKHSLQKLIADQQQERNVISFALHNEFIPRADIIWNSVCPPTLVRRTRP